MQHFCFKTAPQASSATAVTLPFPGHTYTSDTNFPSAGTPACTSQQHEACRAFQLSCLKQNPTVTLLPSASHLCCTAVKERKLRQECRPLCFIPKEAVKSCDLPYLFVERISDKNCPAKPSSSSSSSSWSSHISFESSVQKTNIPRHEQHLTTAADSCAESLALQGQRETCSHHCASGGRNQTPKQGQFPAAVRS